MKYLLFLASLFTTTVVLAQKSSNQDSTNNTSIYDFKIQSLDGGVIDFAQFKGKKILVVNTASKCGYTPQYQGLEALYERYKDKLVIVGFPSDNFGGQEYGKDEEIMSFCQKNYGVTFPLTTRVDVKGDNATPVYKFLCNKSANGVLDATISWNFNKFLLDENGNIVAYFNSKVKPDGQELMKLLGE